MSTHRPHLAALANKFVAWRAMNPPTKAQQIMIEDGLPTGAVIQDDERLESWKGRRLSRPSTSIERPKTEDPATRSLRKEIEATEARKKADRLSALRDAKQAERDASRAVIEAAQAAQAATQETDVKKASAAKKTATATPARGKGSSAKKKSKNGRAAAVASARKPVKPKAEAKPRDGRVSGQQVADFVSRAGGASMAELVAEFGIEAHPMRAKIHYARHTLGYAIEVVDGRYVGTAPKKA